MDIVLCADKNFAKPAHVTLFSLCHNNPDVEKNFHIITDSDSRETLECELDGEEKRLGIKLNFHTIPKEWCSVLPVGQDGQSSHITLASYYRLFLSSVLPEEIEKVLYIDCDIIVRGDVSGLLDTDMTGKAIAGVSDMNEGDVRIYNRLGYYPCEGYFNAGVLVINLKYWRDHALQEEFLRYAQANRSILKFHDQDILIFTLRKSRISLPLRYNVQEQFLWKSPNFIVWDRLDEYNEAISQPVIVHYTAMIKPWHAECSHPWTDEYLKYVEICGLDIKDFPQLPEDPFMLRVKKYILTLVFGKHPMEYNPSVKKL